MPVDIIMALEKAVTLAKEAGFVRDFKSKNVDDHHDDTTRKTNNAHV